MAARSRSASASTIIGSLPPSSSETGVSVSAARAMTRLPVSLDPVNMTMSAASITASPACRSPATTSSTSSGRPTSRMPSAISSEVSGVADAGLSSDGVARGQRGDAVAERVEQRVVPRADDADQPVRLVAHDELAAPRVGVRGADLLVGQIALGVPGPEAERRRAVGDLGDQRVVVGLAGLRDDRVRDPVRVVEQPLARAPQDLAAGLEAERGPRGLRRARPCGQRGHLRRAHRRDRGDDLARRRVLDGDLRRGSGRGLLLDGGHRARLAEGQLLDHRFVARAVARRRSAAPRAGRRRPCPT